jgi:hypothetical protein
MSNARALLMVRVLHTAIWGFLAGAIVALLLMAIAGVTHGTVLLSAMVWIEIAVLAANGWKCPLTSVAERLTDDRGDTFDIILPPWLSRNSRWIFTPMFLTAQVVLLWRGLATGG